MRWPINQFLAIVCLSLSAFGQATYSYPGASSGSATYAVITQGAPLTYGARTDLCVTGSEPGCTGLGLSFQMRTTDTPPFATMAPAGSAVKDADFHSFLFMLTDQSTRNGPGTTSTPQWEVNSEQQATINQNDTFAFLHIEAGKYYVFVIDPSAIATYEAAHPNGGGTCTNCFAPTSIIGGAVESSCGTGCTKLDSQGVYSWSQHAGEANTLLELRGDNVTLNKLAIQPGCTVATASSCTFSRTAYAKMTDDSVVPCSLWGAQGGNYRNGGWNGILESTADGTVGWDTGGAPDWMATTNYTATDSFVYPSLLNTGKHAFQATNSGQSVSEPNWDSTCPNTGQTCTDGGVTWVNTGKVGGQGYGFDVLTYNPARGCSRMNTYNGRIYRGTNQGPNYPAAGTPDPSGAITTDDNLICAPYGVSPCPLTDGAKIHDGSQNADPHFSSWTSNAQICLSGNCACTSQTNANFLGAYNPALTYSSTTYDTVTALASPYSLYAATVGTVPINTPPPNASYWVKTDSACSNYIWEIATTNVRPLLTRGSGLHPQADGHVVQGYVNNYHGTSGPSQLYSHLVSKPTIDGHANTGVGTFPLGVNLGSPYHASYQNRGTADASPYMIFAAQVPSGDYATGPNPPGSAPANQPYWAELIGVKFDLTPCSPPGYCANSGNLIYRFAHTYNSSSSPVYNIQNSVSVISSDGAWALVTSDQMGTRGSTSPDWLATNTYALGDTIYPLTGNNNKFGFYATAGGTSGSSEPAWDSSCTSTCADGGVTWTREAAACNQTRGFFNPTANATFSTGQSVMPISTNVIFTAIAGGTTDSTLPNWNTTYSGTWGNAFCDDSAHEFATWPGTPTCTANPAAAVWRNVGQNDCRSDVMLVDLLSAH